jgi:type I restriction enzyme M protein
MVRLADICRVVGGSTPRTDTPAYWNGDIVWITPADLGKLMGYNITSSARRISKEGFNNSGTEMLPSGSVVLSTRAPIGHLAIARIALCTNQGCKSLVPNAELMSEYLYFSLKQAVPALQNLGSGATFTELSKSALSDFQIPLPPLSVQQEIVAEIEGYQRVIDGARAVIDNYKPHIRVEPEWEMVKLGEICRFKNGLNYTKDSSGFSVKIIGVGDFGKNTYVPLADLSIVTLNEPIVEDYLVKPNDILFVRSNGNPDLVGRSLIVPATNESITFSGFSIRARVKDERVLPIFLAHLFKSSDFAEMIKTVSQGANIRSLSQEILNEIIIPLPPLATQQALVAEIEAEQALVAANRELIERMEKKIKAVIARVWGEVPPI